MNQKKFLVLPLLFLWSSAFAEITLKNWLSHHSIKEVRKIYQEIHQGVKQKRYKLEEKKGNEDCGKMICYPNRFQITAKGKILACGFTYLVNQNGIEVKEEIYFDQKGNGRFFLRIEDYISLKITRIYYDQNGRFLWGVDSGKNKRYVKTDLPKQSADTPDVCQTYFSKE